jgi:hypothetical protein
MYYCRGMQVDTMTVDRMLMSCEDCVFCIDFYTSWSVPPTTRFLCNLGLDTKFHVRNGYDDLQIGCKNINPNPITPCKARYTAEEMCKLLGV